ncbi:MAG: hypothetical protein GOMPHAMPRED_000822 [Gomphillus americanus]|uniref:Uncharacterized protein n=1 Tax=Gomphillus americanus TaxID=1940652 RepID=A0A8H3IJ87_9LECA|nr:MAG: hypothetical protein GOMPHAMPRED_000822 [Gomphillus americanus]
MELLIKALPRSSIKGRDQCLSLNQPLISAITKHSLLIVGLLPHASADIDAYKNSSASDTPLVAASRVGSLQALELLIANKASLNVLSHDGQDADSGMTALMVTGLQQGV